MNEYYNIKRLALILAIQAEIEGMKAENKQREIQGDSMAFIDKDFTNRANALTNLAYAPNEEL